MGPFCAPIFASRWWVRFARRLPNRENEPTRVLRLSVEVLFSFPHPLLFQILCDARESPLVREIVGEILSQNKRGCDLLASIINDPNADQQTLGQAVQSLFFDRRSRDNLGMLLDQLSSSAQAYSEMYITIIKAVSIDTDRLLAIIADSEEHTIICSLATSLLTVDAPETIASILNSEDIAEDRLFSVICGLLVLRVGRHQFARTVADLDDLTKGNLITHAIRYFERLTADQLLLILMDKAEHSAIRFMAAGTLASDSNGRVKLYELLLNPHKIEIEPPLVLDERKGPLSHYSQKQLHTLSEDLSKQSHLLLGDTVGCICKALARSEEGRQFLASLIQDIHKKHPLVVHCAGVALQEISTGYDLLMSIITQGEDVARFYAAAAVVRTRRGREDLIEVVETKKDDELRAYAEQLFVELVPAEQLHRLHVSSQHFRQFVSNTLHGAYSTSIYAAQLLLFLLRHDMRDEFRNLSKDSLRGILESFWRTSDEPSFRFAIDTYLLNANHPQSGTNREWVGHVVCDPVFVKMLKRTLGRELSNSLPDAQSIAAQRLLKNPYWFCSRFFELPLLFQKVKWKTKSIRTDLLRLQSSEVATDALLLSEIRDDAQYRVPTIQAPETDMMRSEENQILYHILAKLEPEERELISMHLWQGISLTQIAKSRQTYTNKIKRAYDKAIHRLRIMLETGGY